MRIDLRRHGILLASLLSCPGVGRADVLLPCGDAGFGEQVYPGHLEPGLRPVRSRGFHPERGPDGAYLVESPQIVDLAASWPATGGLRLREQVYRYLFIDVQGLVSLGEPESGYVADLGLDRRIPVEQPDRVAHRAPVIAPFASAVATQLCERPRAGEARDNAVYMCQRPGQVIVTWHDVLPMSGPCDAALFEREKNANAFQLVLESKAGEANAMTIEFRYARCDWMNQAPFEMRGWAAIRLADAPDDFEPLARIANLAVPLLRRDPPDGLTPRHPLAVAGLQDLCRASNLDPPEPGVFAFDLVDGEPRGWPSRGTDSDQDGLLDDDDNCPGRPNLRQLDGDEDGIGDVCDDDLDRDGIPNREDNCPLDWNPLQENMAGDFVPFDVERWRYGGLRIGPHPAPEDEGDACDTDTDGDGIDDDDDSCATIWNRYPLLQRPDRDRDGIGDYCDTDIDGDGIPNQVMAGPRYHVPLDGKPDNCPTTPNPSQLDQDDDGRGDRCDPDRDGDLVPNCDGPCIVRDGLIVWGEGDNCPDHANTSQADRDGDGVGDACAHLLAPSIEASAGRSADQARQFGMGMPGGAQ